MKNKKFKEEDIEFIKNNYKNLTHKSMGEKLGLKTTSVRYICEKFKFKKGSGCHARVRKIHTINDKYFTNFNEKSSYILGFIAADGHIMQKENRYRLIIGIHKKDLYLLDFIKNEICPTAKIRHYKDSVHLTIYCKKLVEDLNSIGFDSKKTNISKIFEIIPEKFHMDFIRGFFDGDGCISYSFRSRGKYKSVEAKISFTNLDLELLKKIGKILGISYLRKRLSKNIYYSLETSNSKKILDIYNKFYKNECFCLDRKKKKFEKFFIEKENVYGQGLVFYGQEI